MSLHRLRDPVIGRARSLLRARLEAFHSSSHISSRCISRYNFSTERLFDFGFLLYGRSSWLKLVLISTLPVAC